MWSTPPYNEKKLNKAYRVSPVIIIELSLYYYNASSTLGLSECDIDLFGQRKWSVSRCSLIFIGVPLIVWCIYN